MMAERVREMGKLPVIWDVFMTEPFVKEMRQGLVTAHYQDNREDVAYLWTVDGKATCAEVIVDGVEDYIKER